MADHQEATFTLPSDAASVRIARSYVAETLGSWGLPDDAPVADSIALIISELATNAVRHTCGLSPSFTVDLRLERAGELRIGVTDSHPGRPRRLPAGAHRDSGRGMLIIGCLTAECGGDFTVTSTADGGKTVWITLPWAVPVPVPVPVTAPTQALGVLGPTAGAAGAAEAVRSPDSPGC